MDKEIIINSNPLEIRAAIVEDGRLVEFYVERGKDRGLTGNVYKGKVMRVLPGMQAAFVEVGLDRTAFLHAKDVREAPDDLDYGEKGGSSSSRSRIQDLLKEGQEMVGQVAKEPMGTKGARLTSYVSLPGRHLVLMPTYDRVGVSRRIGDEKERRRLRDIVASLRPPGVGFIIRTVCEGVRKEDIKADMEFLLRLWRGIQKKAAKQSAPALIYEELDLTLRMVRDVFSHDVKRLVIDSVDEYTKAVEFIEEVMPSLRKRVELYKDSEPIFDAHGIELEIEAALDKKVWLRSGGHLVIDQMEALTAIDVNTGKYVGKKNSEETILKTNLEAVAEVVYHLRLRNIGGIIVIDFIDMARTANRMKVYNALKDGLKADKARTNILKISELGIAEMTRKRVRESLAQGLCEPCPYCDGNGLVKDKDTLVAEIYRDLLRDLPQRKRKVLVYANPVISERLGAPGGVVEKLEKKFKKRIVVKPVELFHQEEYEVV
ncbi:MAG: Rne/Rng family ribonuclease [Thermodesulfobacteriota bacterium]